jgi:hypothetical protein
MLPHHPTKRDKKVELTWKKKRNRPWEVITLSG